MHFNKSVKASVQERALFLRQEGKNGSFKLGESETGACVVGLWCFSARDALRIPVEEHRSDSPMAWRTLTTTPMSTVIKCLGCRYDGDDGIEVEGGEEKSGRFWMDVYYKIEKENRDERDEAI